MPEASRRGTLRVDTHSSRAHSQGKEGNAIQLRSSISLALVVAGAFAVAGAGAGYTGPLHGGPHPGKAAKFKVAVVLKEWTVTPSVRSVKAGRITFVVRNRGRVEHELVVVRTNRAPNALPAHLRHAAHMAAHVHVAPRHSGFLTLMLRPGRYVLFCGLPGHYEAGQHTGFRVR